MTLNLGRTPPPDRDIAVVPGPPTPAGDYPTTALRVVEVSDTTLRYDRGRKARTYAAARIADDWIVNRFDGQVGVHRDRVFEPTRRPRRRHATVSVARPGDALSPIALPGVRVAVADLLPRCIQMDPRRNGSRPPPPPGRRPHHRRLLPLP